MPLTRLLLTYILALTVFSAACDNDPYCPEGTSWCWAKCVDLQNDENNCGACDNACESGFSCIGGRCACNSDSECDDGQWCNGQEVCTDGYCEHGTQVNCDDGASCTEDLCDEDYDICVNVPDHTICNLCDEGGFCGIGCVCDPELLGNPSPPCISCPVDSGCIDLSSDCDDGDPCTLDFCNEETDECEHIMQPNPGAEGPEGDPTCSNEVDDDCDELTDHEDSDCYINCDEVKETLSEEIDSTNQGCTAVVRIRIETMEVLGYALECGPYHTPTEEEAIATARSAYCMSSRNEMLNPPGPEDEYVFYSEIDGLIAAVSASTGLVVFCSYIDADSGRGQIFFPDSWRPSSELGIGCTSSIIIQSSQGYNITAFGWDVLPTEDVDAVLDGILNTALPAAFDYGGSVHSAVVISYSNVIFFPEGTFEEWVVLVNGGP